MDETTDEDERERTAVHEAGHAVFWALLCQPFQDVTIEPAATYAGRVRVGKSTVQPGGPPLPRQVVHEMMALCAGDFAEQRIRGGDTYTVLVYRNPMSDGALIQERLNAFGPVADQIQQIAFGATVALLHEPAVWRAVEQVRDLLLERTTLPYALVERVVSACVAGEADKIRAALQPIFDGHMTPQGATGTSEEEERHE